MEGPDKNERNDEWDDVQDMNASSEPAGNDEEERDNNSVQIIGKDKTMGAQEIPLPNPQSEKNKTTTSSISEIQVDHTYTPSFSFRNSSIDLTSTFQVEQNRVTPQSNPPSTSFSFGGGNQIGRG